MRHLVSLMFGLLLAPVIWFLAALGHYRLLAALPRNGQAAGSVTELALGALLIVAAGVWLGLLLGTRLSPVGPALAGLAWLGFGAAFILDVQTIAGLLPDGPTGQDGLYTLPLEHGYAFLVGTALLVPLFSPARWRGKEQDFEEETEIVPYGTLDDTTSTGRHDADNVQPLTNGYRGARDRPYARDRAYRRDRTWSGAAAARDEDVRGPDTSAIQPPRHWGENADRPARQWER
jgi:hypothetical protein